MLRSGGDSPNQRTPLPAGSMDAGEEWAAREMFDAVAERVQRSVATPPSEYGRERESVLRPAGPRSASRSLPDLLFCLPELIGQLPARLHRYSTSERTHLVEQCAQLKNLSLLGNTPRLLRCTFVALHTSQSAEGRPAVTALVRGWQSAPLLRRQPVDPAPAQNRALTFAIVPQMFLRLSHSEHRPLHCVIVGGRPLRPLSPLGPAPRRRNGTRRGLHSGESHSEELSNVVDRPLT